MNFAKMLKDEMIQNPTVEVAPMVAILLSSNVEFNSAHVEGYTYETIGGNHSRIALQQIIQEGTAPSLEMYIQCTGLSVCTEGLQMS